MANYPKGAPSNGSVYVCNLPPGTNDNMLASHFGNIGVIKVMLLARFLYFESFFKRGEKGTCSCVIYMCV